MSNLAQRLREEAHLFEMHDPDRGITIRSRLDVALLRAAADEIERLRAGRDAALEEAAKVADSWGDYATARDIAKRIRALKQGENGHG